MKKTYIAPSLSMVTIETPLLNSTSGPEYGGDDNGDGEAESKGYFGGFLWEDYEEEK